MVEKSLGSTKKMVGREGKMNGEPLQYSDRSCTWPIYILSHFEYLPRWLSHWLNGVGGLPALHGLLQAPGQACCQSFWLQNGSGVYPPMTARRWEFATFVSLHTIFQI